MRHFTQIIQKCAIFYSDFFIIWSITLLSVCTIKKVTLLQTENKERQMYEEQMAEACARTARSSGFDGVDVSYRSARA